MNISNPDKKYHHGSHAVYSCQYHIIWCPKYRRKVLTNGIDERLREIIIEKQEDYGYSVIEMEIMPDHVHLLIDVDPTRYGVNNVVSKIKGYSSHVLREEFPQLKTKLPTLWSRARFISTVGAVSLDVVKRYIEDQKNV